MIDLDLLEKYKYNRVLATYIRLGFVRNKKDAEALHMFFSPTCVPVGLEHNEVRLCINLHPLRAKQKEEYEKMHGKWVTESELRKAAIEVSLIIQGITRDDIPTKDRLREEAANIEARLPPLPDVLVQLPTMSPPCLPSELLCSESSAITREKFYTGIRTFIEQAISRTNGGRLYLFSNRERNKLS